MNLANFPDLEGSGYQITSEIDYGYNCIAWAAGKTDNWWWPDEDGYWPEPKPAEITLGAVVAIFTSLGYEGCDTPDHEPGYEKVALYGKADDDPTHAAREIGPGLWSSKIGQNEDITHTLDGLAGPLYGTPRRFMRRQLPAA